MARRLLEQLPVEIQGVILRTVPDVTTLFALISASPQFLQLYLSQKDQVRISVVSNQLGGNLTSALYSIRRCSSELIPHWRVTRPPSLGEARLLYKQDHLFNSLIQQCIDVQLDSDSQLSEIESFRMRRGIYNYAAVRLSNEQDSTLFELCCEALSPKEVLEVLYIIHCLRDLAANHITRLEDLLVEKILDGTLHADRQLGDSDWSFFEDYGEVLQTDWLMNAPWLLSPQEFLALTLPAVLADTVKFETNWDDYAARLMGERLTCEEVLRNKFPTNYLFDQSSFPGRNPYVEPDIDPALWQDLFSRSISAIPVGYMIWDKRRLSQMSWVKDLLEEDFDESQVRWQQPKHSVESRVFNRGNSKNQNSDFPGELRHA